MIDKKSSYPVILVPGVLGYGDDVKLSKVMPYFGTMSASAAKTIRSLDIPCLTATFTPAAGIWERTCELYAQIAGGTVTITMGAGDTDGIDANGNILISGGTVSITGSSPFDYEGSASFTGGTVYVNGQQVNSLPNQMMGGEMGGMGSFGGQGGFGGGPGGPGGFGGGPGGPGGFGGGPGGGRP